MTSMTKKQQQFVDEYLIDLNATQAAVRAGYSSRNADKIGSQLLGKTRIAAAVQTAMTERQKRTQISQDRVLQELARIAFFDIRKLYRSDGSMKSMHELDDDTAAAVSFVDVLEVNGKNGSDAVSIYTKKAKMADKITALSLAMRHLAMLVDRTEVTGKNGGPLPPLEYPTEQAMAALRERMRQRLGTTAVPPVDSATPL